MDENTRVPEPVPDGYFRITCGSVSISLDILQDDDQMQVDLDKALDKTRALLVAMRETR